MVKHLWMSRTRFELSIFVDAGGGFKQLMDRKSTMSELAHFFSNYQIKPYNIDSVDELGSLIAFNVAHFNCI